MKKTIAILMLGLATVANAQKIKVLEGDLAALKGQTTMNTTFSYEGLTVGKDKTEEEYVKKKKDEYNKKEAGKGDKWAVDWVDDRANRYEPKFRELFFEHSKMKFDENATYTLQFHTTRIEPGFNVGVMRQNAYIDAEVWIVETANKDKVVAKLTVANSPGATAFGYDFDTGVRITEAYAKAGKELGQLIVKKTK